VSIGVPEGFESAQAFLDAFAANVGALVGYIDTEERVRFMSRNYEEWFKRPREALVGRSLEEIYEPEEYAQFQPSVRRALAGEDVHYERQATRPDGASCWITVNLRPHRDSQGRIVGLFSCDLEVKELKRTHDALGHALEEIATHIEPTPLGVVEWSAELRVKRWSPQAEEIFGWTLDEVLGKT